MEEFWNEFDLKKPPLLTIRIKGAQFCKAERLQSILNNFLQQQNNAVHKEFAQGAALLSRLMARRKNSFRKMMVFKSICKLNSALCRLLRVDLPRVVENFSSALPDVEFETTKVYVPSRNNFDFVLVRLLSVYKIHQRITECCMEAATFIAKMLRTNFFMEINTLLLAVIAKIRNNNLCNNYIKLYDQILPYRSSFPQNEKYTFLPNNFEFPQKLNQMDTVSELTSIADDIKVEDLQEATVVTNYPPPVSTKLKKKCDVGTVVDRKTSNVRPMLNLNDFQTVDDITKFIVSEKKMRAISTQNCQTKTILSHEWNGAVRLFEKKLEANETKKAVSIFKKFLSSKI